MTDFLHRQAVKAAEAIRQSDCLIIGAGAGMGVDSGLPDFRGQAGFWQAYPGLKGLDFTEIANPEAFTRNPRQAWGFYGHRLNLYRQTKPHPGFDLLRKISESRALGCFIFTSNVDGQFQKAGFSAQRIVECHGSIHHLQCCQPCSLGIWSAAEVDLMTDDAKCLAQSDLPLCLNCGAVARPNILMFGDWNWLGERTEAQQANLQGFLAAAKKPVILEIGAGTAVPTVRYFCQKQQGVLVRINPRDYAVDRPTDISMPGGAMTSLHLIDRALNADGY